MRLIDAKNLDKNAGEGEQVLLQGVIDCFYEDRDGLVVVDFKTDRVFTEELLKASLVESLADAFHKSVVEVEVMNYTKSHSEHFASLKEMSDICSAIFLTNRTTAVFINRTHICCVLIVVDIYNTVPSK